MASADIERALFFYPHLKAALRRLPEHYKQRYMVNQSYRRPPVHYQPYSQRQPAEFVTHEGRVHPVRHYDLPVQVFFPEESHKGLWANEGIVYGFRQREKHHQVHPRFWRPHLFQNIFYSEILQRWMTIIVTHRALSLIEAAGSLDKYILDSSDGEINSRLGLHLKRDMLTMLAKLPDTSELKAKYRQYLVPLEEAEWIGLSLMDACKKQLKIEADCRAAARSEPKKFAFLRQLQQQILAGQAPNSA